MIKKNIKKIIFIFLLFGFVGWLLEKVLAFFLGQNQYRSFVQTFLGLNIPFLPIYGIGALILFGLSKIQRKVKLNFVLRVLFNGIVLSIYELISGLFSTYILKTRFWGLCITTSSLFVQSKFLHKN